MLTLPFRRLASVLTLLGVMFGSLGILGVHAAAPAAAATNQQATTGETQPTVVVLTEGVDWRNIASNETPHLAAWAASGSMFNVVPPSVGGWTCPEDVTLAMGAGERLHSRTVTDWPSCPPEDFSAGAQPHGWSRWFQGMQRDRNYAPIGNFGHVLASTSIEAKAVGNSAALLLIDAAGEVPQTWEPAKETDSELAEQVSHALEDADLVVVDASATNFALQPNRSLATERRVKRIEPPDEEPEPVDVESVNAQAREFAEKQSRINAQRAEAVFAELEPGTPVLFVSLMEVNGNALQPAFLSAGPGGESPVLPSDDEITTAQMAGHAWDPQVRQDGTVQYTSLLPTVMAGVNPDALSNPAWNLRTDVLRTSGTLYNDCSPEDSCFTSRIDRLQSGEERASAITAVRGSFFRVMSWATIAFIVLSIILFAPAPRRSSHGRGAEQQASAEAHAENHSWKARAARAYDRLIAWLRPIRKLNDIPAFAHSWRVIGLTISAVPVSSHITTVIYSWWEAESPYAALMVGTWVVAFIIGLIAYIANRSKSYGPLVAIAALTAILLAVEVATGSHNLIDAPMGFNTLIGARFYGLGNEGFALLGTATLITLAFIAHAISKGGAEQHGRNQRASGQRPWDKRPRFWAASVIAVIGMGVLVIVVWPTMGADFGGALALVPALALLVLLVSGARPSWQKLVLVGVLAVIVAFGVAIMDWMRGASARTHLGNFIQAIVDGDAFDIVTRKISVNLRLLTASTHRWVVLAAIVAIAFVVVPLLKSLRESTTIDAAGDRELIAHEGEVAERTPNQGITVDTTLVYALASVGLCLLVAFLLNDSGIVLPGMGAILLMPMLLTELDRRRRQQKIYPAKLVGLTTQES